MPKLFREWRAADIASDGKMDLPAFPSHGNVNFWWKFFVEIALMLCVGFTLIQTIDCRHFFAANMVDNWAS